MSNETNLGAVHVEANPAATIDEAPAAKLELLDKDEIVELSIKPSLWFIAIVSARIVVLVGVLAAAVAIVMRDSGSLFAAYAVSLGVLAAVLRVVVASLQWASRVYILTNRRVMRFSGVLNVQIAECPLKRIGKTNLRLETVQRALRLGSICMTPAVENETVIVWDHVAKAGQVYEQVLRAIRKAQSGK
ncbi:MAG: PH domain-containing protein [Phycisphaerae bacterium]